MALFYGSILWLSRERHLIPHAMGYIKMYFYHPQSMEHRYQSERELAADLLKTKERLFNQLRITFRDSKGVETSC